MQSRAIGIIAAGAVLAISIFLKGNSHYDTRIDAYYVVNLIIISATVMVALALSLIISYASKRKAAAHDPGASGLPNRRDHYRISYEAGQRPILRIEAPSLELTGEHEFDVLDISEQGIRFLNDRNVHFRDTVQGALVFIDNDTVMIEGQIVRETGAQLSLKLSSPIPFKSIIKEQRRIISDQRYQDKFSDRSAGKEVDQPDD
jgi:hypothetical protein